MTRYIFLLSISILISCNQNKNGTDSKAGTEATEFKDLTLNDFMKQYTAESTDSTMLLDVRTPPEFNEGTINGAVMINFLDENIDQQLSLLDKNKKYYIFCQQGGRSKKCMDKMKALGFKKVYNLLGGYAAFSGKQ